MATVPIQPSLNALKAYPVETYDLISLNRWDAVKTRHGRERKVGKAPLNSRWTTIEEPRHNVLRNAAAGCNAGWKLRAGQLVIDVDVRHGGIEGFADLCKDLECDFADFHHVVTGAGGHHYYMTMPEDFRAKVTVEPYPGCEFKSVGAQVLTSGCVHPDTGRYYKRQKDSPRFRDPLRPAPAGLLELICRPVVENSHSGGEVEPHEIVNALNALDPAAFGTNDKWLRLAMAVHHATGGGARAEFLEWSACDPDFANDSDRAGRRWDSFDKERDSAITLGTFNQILRDNNLHSHQVNPIRADEAFEEMMEFDIRDDADDFGTPLEAHSGIQVTSAADIEPEPIRWLWPGRLALGKMSIIGGLPNQGKTQIALSIAATVSNGGSWPNAEGRTERGGIAILSAEDDPADTLIPRLKAAGADLTQVHIINPIVRRDGQARVLNLMDDLSGLATIVQDKNIKVVIIDPIGAYLGGGRKGDSHKNADVRAMLTPVTEWAGRLGVAVIAISHFNKSGNGHAIHRITDSQAFTAAARSVWLTADEPGETGRKLLLEGKNNIAAAQAGLAYRIEGVDIEGGINAPRIVWEGTTTLTAAEALDSTERKPSQVDAAVTFLEDILDGGPVSAVEAKRRAEEAGFSTATLNRAKVRLAVMPERRGFQGKVHWRLAENYVGEDDFG